MDGDLAPPAIEALALELARGLAAIRQEICDWAAGDRFKEAQVDRLHQELQAYRTEQQERPVRQVLLAVVRLHDDLGKVRRTLGERPAVDLTPDLFFHALDDLRDDLELLLGQHGVEPFTVAGEDFDPHRQTALKAVPATDPSLVGRIADRLRPGFEQGDRLLQKERVAVWAAAAPVPEPSLKPASGEQP